MDEISIQNASLQWSVYIQNYPVHENIAFQLQLKYRYFMNFREINYPTIFLE